MKYMGIRNKSLSLLSSYNETGNFFVVQNLQNLKVDAYKWGNSHIEISSSNFFYFNFSFHVVFCFF